VFKKCPLPLSNRSKFDLLDLVEQMNSQLAGHKHGPTPPPENTGELTGNAASALLLSGKLKPITG
jgi:hypothetical protein